MAYKIPNLQKGSIKRMEERDKADEIIDTYICGNISEARKSFKVLKKEKKFIVDERAKQTLTEEDYSTFKRLVIYG